VEEVLVGGGAATLGVRASRRAVSTILAGEAAGDAAEAVKPLVYGPTAGGRLAETAERLGGETLNDLGVNKPPELGWLQFSKQTLDAAAASGRPVIFDLTNMETYRAFSMELESLPMASRRESCGTSTRTGADSRRS
jgi:hypothetical protein